MSSLAYARRGVCPHQWRARRAVHAAGPRRFSDAKANGPGQPRPSRVSSCMGIFLQRLCSHGSTVASLFATEPDLACIGRCSVSGRRFRHLSRTLRLWLAGARLWAARR